MAFVAQASANMQNRGRRDGVLSVNAEQRLIRMAKLGIRAELKRMTELQPFKDNDGVWKAKGMLENVRDLPREMRNPTLLPNVTASPDCF